MYRQVAHRRGFAFSSFLLWISISVAKCFAIQSRGTTLQKTSSLPFRSGFSLRIVPPKITALKAHLDGNDSNMFHRRSVIQTLVSSASSIVIPSLTSLQPCYADDTVTPRNTFSISFVSNSIDLPLGLLESRVLENVMSPPTYGMEGADVFYPSWLAGTWNVASTTTSVEAPCGQPLFGAKAMYAAAQADVGTTLHYESRFIDLGTDASGNSVIADRAFNIESIAMAAVGTKSVLDMTLVTPNKVSVILAPPGAPNLVKIDLLTLNRRQEEPDASHFHCSEVVREILSPIGNRDAKTALKAPILKEVETTSLYQLIVDPKTKVESIKCRQRSASYLVPSQDNPTLFRMWEMSQGKPVDVRFFDVLYTRKKD